MPFALAGWATGSSRCGPPRYKGMHLGILSWASAPLQRMPKHRAAALEPLVPQEPGVGPMTDHPLAAPPLRFRPLQRLPSSGQRHELVGPAFPDRLRLQVLATSWRLHPPRASPALFHAGSAPGVTLQSFVPPAQPYAVPGAFPLLAFPPPSGFCSTRESVSRSSCSS